MKEKVLAYLKQDRSFETGKMLYEKYGLNNALKRTLNMQGAHGNNHNLMMHELAKDAGISESELLSILENSVVMDPIVPAEDNLQAKREMYVKMLQQFVMFQKLTSEEQKETLEWMEESMDPEAAMNHVMDQLEQKEEAEKKELEQLMEEEQKARSQKPNSEENSGKETGEQNPEVAKETAISQEPTQEPEVAKETAASQEPNSEKDSGKVPPKPKPNGKHNKPKKGRK